MECEHCKQGTASLTLKLLSTNFARSKAFSFGGIPLLQGRWQCDGGQWLTSRRRDTYGDLMECLLTINHNTTPFRAQTRPLQFSVYGTSVPAAMAQTGGQILCPAQLLTCEQNTTEVSVKYDDVRMMP